MSEAGASLVDEKLGLNVVPKTKASDSIFPERLLEGEGQEGSLCACSVSSNFFFGKCVVLIFLWFLQALSNSKIQLLHENQIGIDIHQTAR